jgi:outer membrane receptor for monomeric catechols
MGRQIAAAPVTAGVKTGLGPSSGQHPVRLHEKPEAPMPLEFDESPAVYDFARNAVMFTAMHGRRLVRFRVTNHALANMAKCQTRSEIEMLAAYKSHAEQIHQIAARKFGQRLVDTDGTVLVIERDVGEHATPVG